MWSFFGCSLCAQQFLLAGNQPLLLLPLEIIKCVVVGEID
jgi:hypothetical protein